MSKGATQIDSNTKNIPIFMLGTCAIEFAVMFAPSLLRYFSKSTKTISNEKPVRRRRCLLVRMLPLYYVSVYLLVAYFSTAYSPLSNFVKAWREFYKLSMDAAIYKGTLGNCANSFPKNFKVSDSKKKSNLVLILNESLGNHVFKTDEALEQSPFYRQVVKGDGDIFFDFPNSRTNGGNTESAAPASLSGYLIANPRSDPRTDLFYTAPSLACMAKELNYTTAVYSAQPTFNEHGWRQLNGIFDQFDVQVSPSTITDGTQVFVNDLGMDDRIITSRIVEHIEKLEQDRPFFLLIFWNNNHSPYDVDKDFTPTGTEEEVRFQKAVHSAALTDTMMRQVYDALDKRGFVNDTVMGFLSDHGESAPLKSTRISYPDSYYLSAPMWIRAPKHLLSESERTTLQNNKDKLVGTIDMVPTLSHILGWATPDYLFDVDIPESMIHGQSLLEPVKHDRILPAWQGQPFVRPCESNFGIFSNATHNVIIQAMASTIDIQEVDDKFRSHIVKKMTFDDMSSNDREFWKKHLETYPPMYNTLKQCGFTMPA
jgi:phosphoglycerol transferase MdoB-like AlkP superfamily enzyme